MRHRRYRSSGWVTALGGSVLAWLTVAGIADALAFLQFALASGRRASIAATARGGLLLFLLFHRVPVMLRLTHLSPEAGSLASLAAGSAFQATVTLPLLSGTVLAVLALDLAGRAAGRRASGSAWRRGLSGAAVAIPYAGLSFGASYLARFGAGLPANPAATGTLQVGAGHLGALAWPFAIAAVAGFAGGYRSVPRMEPGSASASAFDRRVRAVLAGGWRMLWLGLALGFAGLLVLAGARPTATHAYFHAVFSGGIHRGLEVILLNALVIPNMAVWTLLAAMGSCLKASAGVRSVCAASYAHFPSAAGGASGLGGLLGGGHTGPAPPGFFAFLMVPLVAVLAGGSRASRQAHVSSPGGALAVGASAGAVFVAFVLAVLALSLVGATFGVRLGVVAGSQSVMVGPDHWSSVLLAMAWAVPGGALGGLMHERSTAEPKPVPECLRS